jgi:hypothetical protein
MVFVHKSVVPFVTGIRSVTVPTGFGETLGNKGGIGVSLNVGKTSFCFVAAHLAAGFLNVERRVEEFAIISREVAESLGNHHALRTSGDTTASELEQDSAVTKSLQFSESHDEKSSEEERNPLLSAFDYVFWFGDLNFRLHGQRKHVDYLLQRMDHKCLLAMDQLQHVKTYDPLLAGLAEGPLNFRPTYKFDPGCGT